VFCVALSYHRGEEGAKLLNPANKGFFTRKAAIPKNRPGADSTNEYKLEEVAVQNC
jgi:hypothetical protein